MEIVSIVTGTIVSTCFIIITLFHLMNLFFYSKNKGLVQENRLENVCDTIVEIKLILERIERK